MGSTAHLITDQSCAWCCLHWEGARSVNRDPQHTAYSCYFMKLVHLYSVCVILQKGSSHSVQPQWCLVHVCAQNKWTVVETVLGVCWHRYSVHVWGRGQGAELMFPDPTSSNSSKQSTAMTIGAFNRCSTAIKLQRNRKFPFKKTPSNLSFVCFCSPAGFEETALRLSSRCDKL